MTANEEGKSKKINKILGGFLGGGKCRDRSICMTRNGDRPICAGKRTPSRVVPVSSVGRHK